MFFQDSILVMIPEAWMAESDGWVCFLPSQSQNKRVWLYMFSITSKLGGGGGESCSGNLAGKERDDTQIYICFLLPRQHFFCSPWMRGFDHQHSPEVSGTSLERGAQMLSLCSLRSDPAYSHSWHCTLFHKNILIEYPPEKVKFAEWHSKKKKDFIFRSTSN